MSDHMKRFDTSGFTVCVADNEAAGVHLAGYNGAASLVPKATGDNIFVPTYGGLNYECTWIDGVKQTDEQTFEPRRAPMNIVEGDRNSVVLHQPPTPFKGIETFVTFRAEEPCYLHQHVKMVFHKELAEGRSFTSLWASYLHAPPDRHVYMKRGGGELDGWVGITKERHRAPHYIVHDLPARELSPAEHIALAEDPPSAPRLESIDGPLDFYYGLYFEHAFIMMFRQGQDVRLAYSPNGGDETPVWSPAWDYVLTIDGVHIGEPYEWDLCLAYKPFEGRRDVLKEVERYTGQASVP
ncbi:MAG: hypothetical protein ACYTAN_02880 [Planctomycetota bacterium]|jgi:hypothetical protein